MMMKTVPQPKETIRAFPALHHERRRIGGRDGIRMEREGRSSHVNEMFARPRSITSSQLAYAVPAKPGRSGGRIPDTRGLHRRGGC